MEAKPKFLSKSCSKLDNVHLRLKNYFDEKTALTQFFENEYLINFSRVKNDFCESK